MLKGRMKKETYINRFSKGIGKIVKQSYFYNELVTPSESESE